MRGAVSPLPQYVFMVLVKHRMHEGVSKSFRTGRLERGLQMVHFSVARWSCIAIFWVSLVSFVAITLCVASQRVFIVVSVHFVRLSPGTFGYSLVCDVECHYPQAKKIHLAATKLFSPFHLVCNRCDTPYYASHLHTHNPAYPREV
jgi:hypothetical protein